MKTQITIEMSTADIKGMCTDNNCGEQVLIINGPSFNLTLPRETIEAGVRAFRNNDRLNGPPAQDQQVRDLKDLINHQLSLAVPGYEKSAGLKSGFTLPEPMLDNLARHIVAVWNELGR